MNIIRTSITTRSLLILLGLLFVLVSGQGRALAAEETLTGRLEAKFVDYDPVLGKKAEVQHLLVDESGAFVEILLAEPRLTAPYGGIRVLLGKTITELES